MTLSDPQLETYRDTGHLTVPGVFTAAEMQAAIADAQAWADELRASSDYRQAALKWEGSLVLEMEADPEKGVLDDRAVFLDLWRNRTRPRDELWKQLQMHSKIMLIGTAALLVFGFVSFLVLEWDGVVAEVGPDLDATGAEVLDAGGCVVAPGFVDLHTHLREPGRERFLARLATRINRHLQTITSLGIPIVYRRPAGADGAAAPVLLCNFAGVDPEGFGRGGSGLFLPGARPSTQTRSACSASCRTAWRMVSSSMRTPACEAAICGAIGGSKA